MSRDNETIDELIKEKSELGQVMDNLDSDKIDIKTNMSSIDMNTRLSDREIRASLVFDELRRLGLMPSECDITRQLKRLKISMNGEGRKEKVQMVNGERQQRSGGGFMSGFSNLFRRREE